MILNSQKIQHDPCICSSQVFSFRWVLSFQQPIQPHRLGAGPRHHKLSAVPSSGKCTELMAMKEVMTNTWEVTNFHVAVLNRMRTRKNWWNQTEMENEDMRRHIHQIDLAPQSLHSCDSSNTSAVESHKKPRHTKAIEFHRHTDQPQPVERQLTLNMQVVPSSWQSK